MVPSTSPAKQISGGQREEGHGVVHHVQGEHHQTYLNLNHPLGLTLLTPGLVWFRACSLVQNSLIGKLRTVKLVRR